MSHIVTYRHHRLTVSPAEYPALPMSHAQTRRVLKRRFKTAQDGDSVFVKLDRKNGTLELAVLDTDTKPDDPAKLDHYFLEFDRE